MISYKKRFNSKISLFHGVSRPVWSVRGRLSLRAGLRPFSEKTLEMALGADKNRTFNSRTFGPLLILLLLVLIFSGCAHVNKEDKIKEKAGVHYRLGNEYYKAGKLADALKEYTRAVEIYPAEPSYHLMLGFAYSSRGLDKRAEGEMKEAIRLNPRFSEAHIGLAFIYKKKGDWDGVIEECNLALENIYYKTPEAAYLNMGIAYYEKGDYSSSVEKLRKAIALKPGLATAYFNMGLALERQKKNNEAIAAYQKAVGLHANYVDAYYRLGLLLVKARDREGAARAFGKVVELAPDSAGARSAKDYLELLR